MRINYIRQVQAFNDRLLSNPLSSGQIALWHALMHINNKCTWIEWFTAANLSLEALCGLSRQGIAKSRNVLKQEGLIDFKSNGTKATSYTIKIIYREGTTSDSLQAGLQDSVQGRLQDSLQVGLQDSVQNSSTLVKQNKTKQNEKKQSAAVADDRLAKVFTLYQKAFGALRPLIAEDLEDWCKDLSPELVALAIEKTAKNNGKSFKYAEKILRDWEQSGVKTLDDVRKIDENFEAERAFKQRGPQYAQKPPKQAETIPEWMESTDYTPADDESTQALEEAMKKLKGGAAH
ncbi:DnaD domain protein [Enterococcus hirae]|nr:DnaD domain protein [Enterococcus hirae]